ncbi:MAG: chemotaxis protein CheW, partial [Desulfatibacillaceae bacterium]|nr:chemotaxis protein CheW [Desulfatibacillaceae bacterium]
AHFLCFMLDSQAFALPLTQVERVVRMAALTPVPQAPAHVAGALNLKGKTVFVVDLRVLLNRPPAELEPEHRLIIVNTGAKTLALIADSATDLVEVERESLEPPPEKFGPSNLVCAVMRREHGLVMVLDSQGFFPKALSSGE